MIKVFILTVQINGGFTMMPLDNIGACEAAMDALPLAIVTSAECYPVELIAMSGSAYAPEMSPLPTPKRLPGRTA